MPDSSEFEIINQIKSKPVDPVVESYMEDLGLIVLNMPQNLLERWFEMMTDYADVISVIHKKELNPIIYHILNEKPPESAPIRKGSDGHNNCLQLISKYDEWKSKKTSNSN